VRYKINSMPIIKNTERIDLNVKDFHLMNGLSPETSGGLLLSIEKRKGEEFVKAMHEKNESVWIVGEVEESQFGREVVFSKELDLVVV
jgi:hydrogenase maturation factor